MNVPHFHLRPGNHEDDDHHADREFRFGLALLLAFWSAFTCAGCASLAALLIGGPPYALIPLAVFAGIICLIAIAVALGAAERPWRP